MAPGGDVQQAGRDFPAVPAQGLQGVHRGAPADPQVAGPERPGSLQHRDRRQRHADARLARWRHGRCPQGGFGGGQPQQQQQGGFGGQPQPGGFGGQPQQGGGYGGGQPQQRPQPQPAPAPAPAQAASRVATTAPPIRAASTTSTTKSRSESFARPCETPRGDGVFYRLGDLFALSSNPSASLKSRQGVRAVAASRD